MLARAATAAEGCRDRRGMAAAGLEHLEKHRGAMFGPFARAALAGYVVGSGEDDDMAERIARGGGRAE